MSARENYVKQYLLTFKLFILLFCFLDESANAEMLSQGPVRGQLFRKAKMKSLRMTALIVAAFVICWTPYYVVYTLWTYVPSKIDKKALQWIFFFGMATSMVNPMIYGAFHVCSKRRKRWVHQYHIQYKSRTRSWATIILINL